MKTKSFSLALGAGGVRGLAHLKILEVLDRHHLKPTCIAGASIGALVGALYASGASSQSIQSLIQAEWLDKLPEPGGLIEKIIKPVQTLRWVKVNLDGKSALQPDKIIDFLLDHFKIKTFEDLQIPLHVVATDYWSGKEVVLNSGELKPALMATMAIPGIFPPVELDDKLLFDGVYANGLPVSQLPKNDDLKIAVDVPLDLNPAYKESTMPHLTEFSQNMIDRLLSNNIQQQLKHDTPDFYLCCPIKNMGILSFEKIESVYNQAEPACEQLTTQLRKWEMIP
ncbi:patatin-like phospholipase family protein [Kiritimatiellota bacterium B12222]|nr:patatin-like phospholipase family protein [Kiritimatiellota bacterium B12222]